MKSYTGIYLVTQLVIFPYNKIPVTILIIVTSLAQVQLMLFSITEIAMLPVTFHTHPLSTKIEISALILAQVNIFTQMVLVEVLALFLIFPFQLIMQTFVFKVV